MTSTFTRETPLENERMTRYLSLFALFGFGLTLAAMSAGCDSPSTSGPAGKGDNKGHSEMTEEQKEIAAELAKLPEADRKLAEEQKICPVTEEPLGSMGKPIKLTVEGKEVFICCASCEDKVKENPEKYLSKIGKE